MNAITPYVPTSLEDLQRTARLLMASGFFAADRNTEVALAQIATRIMAGAELGLGPFTSVQGIHVIQGKPVISANVMAASVKAHPHYDFRVRELTNDLCRLEFFQDGQSLGVESFTMADARAAALDQKDTWRKFPRNMLFARCISNGVRFRCPDVFHGNAVYTPDEIGVQEDDSGWIVAESTTQSTASPATVEAESDSGGATGQPANPRDAITSRFAAAFDGLSVGAAERWYVHEWTGVHTPDRRRLSFAELTAEEVGSILAKWTANPATLETLRRNFGAWQAQQAATRPAAAVAAGVAMGQTATEAVVGPEPGA